MHPFSPERYYLLKRAADLEEALGHPVDPDNLKPADYEWYLKTSSYSLARYLGHPVAATEEGVLTGNQELNRNDFEHTLLIRALRGAEIVPILGRRLKEKVTDKWQASFVEKGRRDTLRIIEGKRPQPNQPQ